MKRCVAVLLALLGSATAVAAPPEAWSRAGYGIQVDGAPLQDVLRQFGESFGVRPIIAPGLKEVVSGRIKAPSAGEFLDRLGVLHRFDWFVFNGSLYVSPSGARTTARIDVADQSVADARDVVKGLGLLEPRFGWGELPGEGAVVVAGPRTYVELVRKALAATKPQDKSVDDVFMVFKVLHAPVSERAITFRNSAVRIPGIVQIVRSLVGAAPTADEPAAPAVVDAAGGAGGLRAAGGGLSTGGGSDATAAAFRTLASASRQMAVENIYGRSGRRRDERGRSVPRIEADVRSNSIVVFGDPRRREEFRRMIEALDQPQALVEIEALIIDIDRSRLSELGVDWAFASNGRSVQSGQQGLPIVPDAASSATTLIIRSLENFYARIRALESKGEARIVAKPSVLTLENQTAVLDLNQTQYISLVGERVANVESVTAGTMLRVTPRRMNEGVDSSFELLIDIEDGFIAENPSLPKGPPIVTRRTVSTQAVISNGQSLAVGGYKLEKERQQRTRVPLLGDLPFIGALFTSVSVDNTATERLFILTPRVLRVGTAQASVQPYVQPPSGLDPALLRQAAPAAARSTEPPQTVVAGEDVVAGPRQRPVWP
jgi:type III secretion protein C